MFYTYFLKSLKNSKVYVGFSSKNPKTRLKEHLSGCDTWTKQNGPFELKYFESYYCEKDARNREKFYKTGIGKRAKQAIIKEFDKNMGG